MTIRNEESGKENATHGRRKCFMAMFVEDGMIPLWNASLFAGFTKYNSLDCKLFPMFYVTRFLSK